MKEMKLNGFLDERLLVEAWGHTLRKNLADRLCGFTVEHACESEQGLEMILEGGPGGFDPG